MTLPPLPEPDAEMPVTWPDGKRTREPLWMRDRMDAYARAAVEAERERVWLEAERLCLERMHASCVMAERATTQESRTRWNAAATDSKCCADRMRAMYIDAARARGAKEQGNG